MRLLALLLIQAAAKTKYDVVDRDDATTFGILIDAGSTGSRVHIYQWEKRDFNTLPPPLSLPLTSERWTERIKPGLSDYNDDAERAARTSVPAWRSARSTHWLIRTQVDTSDRNGQTYSRQLQARLVVVRVVIQHERAVKL